MDNSAARPGALILLQQASEGGWAILKEAWEQKLSETDREACKRDLPALKRRAKEIDNENAS